MEHKQTPVIKKIAIIMAMDDEAKPVIERLKMQRANLSFTPQLGLKSYSQQISSGEIFLIVNGKCPKLKIDRVGTQPAALTAYETIRVLQPDVIISAGTAGGFYRKGAAIGTIYVSDDHLLYHDRRIPLPIFDRYGMGFFDCLDVSYMAEKLKLKKGIISTGNSLSFSSDDEAYAQKYGVSSKEMEAAAVAEVAQLFGTKFLAVKSITNLVSLRATPAEEFTKNFAIAVKNLTDAIPNILSFMMGKQPIQLMINLENIDSTKIYSLVESVIPSDSTEVKDSLQIKASLARISDDKAIDEQTKCLQMLQTIQAQHDPKISPFLIKAVSKIKAAANSSKSTQNLNDQPNDQPFSICNLL